MAGFFIEVKFDFRRSISPPALSFYLEGLYLRPVPFSAPLDTTGESTLKILTGDMEELITLDDIPGD